MRSATLSHAVGLLINRCLIATRNRGLAQDQPWTLCYMITAWGFPNIKGPCFKVPIIRILVIGVYESLQNLYHIYSSMLMLAHMEVSKTQRPLLGAVPKAIPVFWVYTESPPHSATQPTNSSFPKHEDPEYYSPYYRTPPPLKKKSTRNFGKATNKS